MNYLAHLYLSGMNENIIIGNFIADHVKGKMMLKFHPEIQAGIHLHRKIDGFTDSHPVFMSTCNRLYPGYKKYAGVIADMFYDHFLSANWERYSKESIDSFTSAMYRILMKHFFRLPVRTQQMLPFMAKNNWLKAYGTLEGIGRALSGLEKHRASFASHMGEAVHELETNYTKYKQEFETFFPEVKAYAEKQLRDLSSI